MTTDTRSLIEKARKQSRAEFVAGTPLRFLILDEGIYQSDAVGFSTVLVASAALHRGATAARNPTVMTIEKAPGNPYPDRISLGRTRNCDMVLRDPSVSKLHAHFTVAADTGALLLCDADSQNGTRRNGRVLVPNEPVPLQSGDILVFGTVSARLADAAALYDLLR
jgi:hypothetical protein